MLNPTKEWQEEKQAAIILGSARHCWPIRMERVPPANKITWGEWFEKMYKIPLWNYREEFYKKSKDRKD
jgi:hypothetical protein